MNVPTCIEHKQVKNIYVRANGCYIVRQCYCKTGLEEANTWKKTITLKLTAFKCT